MGRKAIVLDKQTATRKHYVFPRTRCTVITIEAAHARDDVARSRASPYK